MTMKQIDARGLACPQPVLLTSKALEEVSEVTTLVDNLAATENLRRFGTKRGCEVQISEEQGGFRVVLRRTGEPSALPVTPAEYACAPGAATVLLVAADTIGQGSEELGKVLIRAFFHTLGEMKELPATVIFMNAGVKLTVSGSPVLEDLQALQGKGVDLVSCGTCLKYFELTERLAVGRISNMYEIAELLFEAGRTVRL